MDFGWGGVADATTPVRNVSAGAECDWHINLKEVAAIRFTLTALAPTFDPGDVIRVVIDSRVALAFVNSLVSRSTALCDEVRRLYTVVQRLGVTLDAKWIPTADNVWADRLSQTKESTDWSLEPPFFSALDSSYGPHAVGRFPAALQPFDGSPVLDLLPLPQHATWARVNNWVNPPFCSIPLALNLIKQERVTAMVVVPVWRAQAWWRPALLQSHEGCYLPRRAGSYFSGAAAAQGLRPHWRVCALRFIRGGRGTPPPPGQKGRRRLVTTLFATAPARPLPRGCWPTSLLSPPTTPSRPRGVRFSTFVKLQ